MIVEILTLGAINALIPLLIILILVAAAAGINRNFGIFGVLGTFAGLSPGRTATLSGKSALSSTKAQLRGKPLAAIGAWEVYTRRKQQQSRKKDTKRFLGEARAEVEEKRAERAARAAAAKSGGVEPVGFASVVGGVLGGETVKPVGFVKGSTGSLQSKQSTKPVGFGPSAAEEEKTKGALMVEKYGWNRYTAEYQFLERVYMSQQKRTFKGEFLRKTWSTPAHGRMEQLEKTIKKRDVMRKDLSRELANAKTDEEKKMIEKKYAKRYEIEIQNRIMPPSVDIKALGKAIGAKLTGKGDAELKWAFPALQQRREFRRGAKREYAEMMKRFDAYKKTVKDYEAARGVSSDNAVTDQQRQRMASFVSELLQKRGGITDLPKNPNVQKESDDLKSLREKFIDYSLGGPFKGKAEKAMEGIEWSVGQSLKPKLGERAKGVFVKPKEVPGKKTPQEMVQEKFEEKKEDIFTNILKEDSKSKITLPQEASAEQLFRTAVWQQFGVVLPENMTQEAAEKALTLSGTGLGVKTYVEDVTKARYKKSIPALKEDIDIFMRNYMKYKNSNRVLHSFYQILSWKSFMKIQDPASAKNPKPIAGSSLRSGIKGISVILPSYYTAQEERFLKKKLNEIRAMNERGETHRALEELDALKRPVSDIKKRREAPEGFGSNELNIKTLEKQIRANVSDAYQALKDTLAEDLGRSDVATFIYSPNLYPGQYPTGLGTLRGRAGQVARGVGGIRSAIANKPKWLGTPIQINASGVELHIGVGTDSKTDNRKLAEGLKPFVDIMKKYENVAYFRIATKDTMIRMSNEHDPNVGRSITVFIPGAIAEANPQLAPEIARDLENNFIQPAQSRGLTQSKGLSFVGANEEKNVRLDKEGYLSARWRTHPAPSGRTQRREDREQSAKNARDVINDKDYPERKKIFDQLESEFNGNTPPGSSGGGPGGGGGKVKSGRTGQPPTLTAGEAIEAEARRRKAYERMDKAKKEERIKQAEIRANEHEAYMKQRQKELDRASQETKGIGVKGAGPTEHGITPEAAQSIGPPKTGRGSSGDPFNYSNGWRGPGWYGNIPGRVAKAEGWSILIESEEEFRKYSS